MIDPAQYGDLGLYLERIIQENKRHVPAFGDNLTANLILLQTSTPRLEMVHELLPVALSLLRLEFPMQVRCRPFTSVTLARHSFKSERRSFCLSRLKTYLLQTKKIPYCKDFQDNYYFSVFGKALCFDEAFRQDYFPVKNYGAATVKTNLNLGPLLRAVRTEFSVTKVGELCSLLPRGINADIVCSFLLYYLSLFHHIGGEALRISVGMVLEPANAKGLSTALKALGLNATMPGCLLVEGLNLQGRGVGPIDWEKEIGSRIDAERVASDTIQLSDKLRESIDYVIRTELDECELPDMNSWWTSRWLWCVNGSENASSDEILGIVNKPRDGLTNRRYRRMAAEEIAVNPVPNWDGRTIVTPSPKLECGKTRAIFACDTANYFAFSYLMNTVQNKWKNSRVLLDPGRSGYVGLVRRILRGQQHGGINLMLDYDNFNAQHSTATMQYVIEKTCQRVGASEKYTRQLCESFDTMYIRYRGNDLHVKGTLMSGHRCTTFINSVLNAAYIIAAIGIRAFERMRSLHTGDDVYAHLDTLSDCVNVLRASADLGCRMNPAKQSIGYWNAEFLRMGISRQGSVGYMARAIPALVCGNWTTEEYGNPNEQIRSVIATCRGLFNRGVPRHVAHILARCLKVFHHVKYRLALPLIEGRIAIEGSPVWSTNLTIRTVELQPTVTERAYVGKDWGRNATKDYLSQHLTPVEMLAIRAAQVDPLHRMVESNYKAGVIPSASSMQVRFGPVRSKVPRGVATAQELVTRNSDKGVLMEYPILVLIKNALTDDHLAELLRSLGLDCGRVPIREFCFGTDSKTKMIVGKIPFSDAANLSRRTSCDIITTNYDIAL